ncbi:MAG: hypothetical protein AAB576_10665, partial [Elusimicrobiota bacterium]
LEALVERRVFGPADERCADLRSPVDALLGLYGEGGGAGAVEKRSALLDRMIILLKADWEKAGVGKDRNLDDNLRFFLEAAERSSELDKLYPRLIKAYPADYVYSYRFAKNLLGRKEFARALPHAETGLRLSYGANRLQAAALKGRVLAGLKRKAQARAFLEAELNAARKRFPKDLKPLEDALKETPATPRGFSGAAFGNDKEITK